MRSKVSKRILNNTSDETKKRVSDYAKTIITMKPNEAIQILIKHQAWRKGEHDEATSPSELTEAMNVAIEVLKKEEKDKSNWERRNKEVDEALDKKFGVEALESVSKADNGEVKTKCKHCKSNIGEEFIPKCYCPECGNEWEAMHEYAQQLPSVKVSDEEIEKVFPCELGQVVIPDEGLTYEQMLLSNYHRRKGAKWMRSRMSNNLNKEV